MRLSVPRPRSERRLFGRPGSSTFSGRPMSGTGEPLSPRATCPNRLPFSKTRNTLPGCITSQCGRGTRAGTTPCARSAAFSSSVLQTVLSF